MADRSYRIAAIIQARMGSTRLPGKVLADLGGQPMLKRVVNRASRAKTLDLPVVATTTLCADDILVEFCESNNWLFFRGSEEDVLDRYYRAARTFDVDIIIRITSDCPLIDPGIIDRVASEFLKCSELDYASNTQIRTFPRGLDVEAIGFNALEKAWQADDNPFWREHVTPYIYYNPDRFRIRNVANEVDYSHMRWTVDTTADLFLVRKIYECFDNDSFSWNDVLKVLRMHPEWLEYNKDIEQKEVP